MTPLQFWVRVRALGRDVRKLQDEAVANLPITKATCTALGALGCVTQLLIMLEDLGIPDDTEELPS